MASLTDSVQKYVETRASATIEASESPEALKLEKEREKKAAKIDTYFSNNKMPLAGYGMKMVIEAEKNDLDWRLIPAMAVRESSGGIHACKKYPENAWGWNSCKGGLGGNIDTAIGLLAQHLSGNHPRTAHYYDGKDVKAILQTYNPVNVVAEYAPQVMAIMNKIDATKI